MKKAGVHFFILLGLLVLVTFFPVPSTYAQAGCCTVRGNCDCSPDGIVDIVDLTRLIDYMLISLDPMCCPEAGNTDGDPNGTIDIVDLTRLIDYMLISFTPLEPCGDSLLAFDRKKVVFDGVDSVFNAIAGAPLDTAASRLVAYLLSRPEIDTAAIMDSLSVWARFTDKTLICIPGSPFVEDSSGEIAPNNSYSVDSTVPQNFHIPSPRFGDWKDAEMKSQQRTSPHANNFELPSSIQAQVMCTVSPTCYPKSWGIATAVKNMLENNGYSTTFAPGSVPSLFNVRDDGVFVYIGHGGPSENFGGESLLALWTTTQTTSDLDKAYGGLLLSNELVYMTMPDFNPATGACSRPWHYGFTGRFVAQRMYFAPNSLVYVTACESDSVASLRNGFKLAGASVFAGWSKVVHIGAALKANEFLFDRLLGANVSTMTEKEHPPQRPFDIDALLKDMQDRGLDTDPDAPNAKLRIHHLQDDFALLAPTIEVMQVDEHNDSLILSGMFGSDPGSHGRVIVGGTELPIGRWEPEVIAATIPNTGAGSVGTVHVEVDGFSGPTYSVKRKSNEVNLTEWNGQIDYKLTSAGTLKQTITIKPHLRGDIHPFRDQPHQQPLKSTQYITMAENSEGSASVSGTYVIHYPPEFGGDLTWNWYGTADIPGDWEENPLNVNQMYMKGWLSTINNTFETLFWATVMSGCHESFTSQAGSYNKDLQVAIVPEVLDGLFKLNLALDNQYNIEAGQRTNSICCGFDQAPQPVELKWQTMTASFAPDSTMAQ